MSEPISRRTFTLTAGSALGLAAAATAGDTPTASGPKATGPKATGPQAIGPTAAGPTAGAAKAVAGPTEAPFTRDYDAPKFKPSWKKPQINRLLVQDFVIYAHFDLPMTKKLLAREPALLNAAMDWGAGDWETGLGGASHMGRRDIAEFLLVKGARIDIFCAAMLGELEAVKAFLTLQPKLIDAKGPHGFSLHFHAQVGEKPAEKVLEYLQSVKKVKLGPNPFLKKPRAKKPG
jgi:hypothetical protein